jgi:maleylpyruvate isomerase
MKLYTYWRSSAAYRVRIALNLKGLTPEMIPVHLTRDGGQQSQPDYLAVNPLAVVPTLVDDGGHVITQSLAIIEYLDEAFPATPRMLPREPLARAWVRSFALGIACEVHPVNNLRVLNYLTGPMGLNEARKLEWYRHWIALGLGGLERLAAASPKPGRFCYGAAPGLADICLVPQMANARRFDCDLDICPNLVRIDAACQALAAFQLAQPSKQIDAEG